MNALKLPVDEDTFMNDLREITSRLVEKDLVVYIGFRELADVKYWSPELARALRLMIQCGYAEVDETGKKAYFKISSGYRERRGYVERFLESFEGDMGDKAVSIFQKEIKDFMKENYGKCYRKPAMEPCELGSLALDTVFSLRNNSFDVEEQQQVLGLFHRFSKLMNKQGLKEASKELLEHYLKPIPKYKPEE